ncbi:MAG: dehydratase [Anaerolineaceae bacterium 4572_78]|nr:MAG: dehydratase [Anaerolineaceae bacterium 4572_78]
MKNTRGLYFEEFELEQQIITPARTITETDIVSFAGLSGDYNPLHTDAVFAESTPYEARIAHGMLALSIATGLVARQGFAEGTVLAFREVKWKFSSPIFIGDTIHLVVTVKGLKPMPKLGGGLVTFQASLQNQHGKTVQRGEWRILMKSKE